MSPEMLAKSKADNGAMDVSAHNKFLATGVQLLIERILRLLRFGCYYSKGATQFAEVQEPHCASDPHCSSKVGMPSLAPLHPCPFAPGVAPCIPDPPTTPDCSLAGNLGTVIISESRAL